MQRTALITGASGGIGKALAYLFAADGYSLVLAARSQDKLERLKEDLAMRYEVRVMVQAVDLSEVAQQERMLAALREEGVEVEFLVNNAGFGLHGEFIRTDLEQEVNMIHLNVIALTRLTKRILPQMVKRGSGRILNVASLAGFFSGPLMSVYYGTKSYVLHFSEALQNELKGTGVSVTALCPGPTKTGFAERADIRQSRLFESGVTDVETVARSGYRGMMRGESVVVPGWRNRLAVFGSRFLPRSAVTALVRKVQDTRV